MYILILFLVNEFSSYSRALIVNIDLFLFVFLRSGLSNGKGKYYRGIPDGIVLQPHHNLNQVPCTHTCTHTHISSNSLLYF